MAAKAKHSITINGETKVFHEKVKRSWSDVIETLREHKCQHIYTTKQSVIDGETKIFQYKNKFT